MIDNYRIRKIGDKYFLSTDDGSSIILNISELKQIKKETVPDNLKKKLLDKEIITKNISKKIDNLRKRNDFLFQGTSLHVIVLTKRCNMSCVYCHAGRENESKKELDMDLNTAKKTVDFIFQSPSNKITIEFQGGEPLLNWSVLKFIVEYAHELNDTIGKDLQIDLVTNMGLMDEEKMDYLIEKNVGVCTSLDGPKELHDKNRVHNKSNYEEVIYWIKKFNDEYIKRDIDSQINALVTITKNSLKYSKEIIDEYAKLGLNMVHLRFLNNLGFAKSAWEKISYTPEEFIGFWNKSIDYIQINKINMIERGYNIIQAKLKNKKDPNYLEMRSPCGAVIGQLAYDYNGLIYTCDEARMLNEDLFHIGNVNQEFAQVVTCDKACSIVNSSINDQFICDTCAYKPYCGVCPVCNYSEQGNIIGKITQTSRCKIYMSQFDRVVKETFIKHNS
ncbi:His-Xaa-Ser system radical SAM maturase HxsB [Candidatus Woesearchaeota archaeon]|nr:MAG: His-Xaa-Ser system radical SAM maturase HxsB [Candidatus Woesearchaeota archaeon]